MGHLLNAALAFALCAAAPRSGDFSKLEATYRIEVVQPRQAFTVKTTHGPITGSAAEGEALQAYAALLNFEFALYPVSFVRRTRLERIALCTQLAFDGQPRASIPDLSGNTLYLDVSSGRHSEVYQRRVIHHEFFHIVDWRDDGELYSDQAWSALNAEGFEYGNGGVNAQGDARMSLLTDEHPGFLTLYGRTGVEEDKAELFSFLFVDPATVAARTAADPVLARKVERMHALLAKVSRDFDAAYWKKIAAVERPRPREPEAEMEGAGQR